MHHLAEDIAGKRQFLGKSIFHLRQISPGFGVKGRRATPSQNTKRRGKGKFVDRA